MDLYSDLESDVVVTEIWPKQAALETKLQVIKREWPVHCLAIGHQNQEYFA